MRRLALSLAIIIYLIFIPLSIAYPMPGKNKPSRRVPYPLPPPNVLKNLRIKADAKVEVGSFALIYWDWESCVSIFSLVFARLKVTVLFTAACPG